MDLVRVDRGQLVLVAAAVVAIGLAPVLLAYLQLGYHPDVTAEPEITGEAAVEFLDRSTHAAAATTAGQYGWDDRAAMADAVSTELEADARSLETKRLDEGVVYGVEYDTTEAVTWADDNCASGPGRQFGECTADGGIVLQERDGDAVLLAVAFDLRIVGPNGRTELTVVVTAGD